MLLQANRWNDSIDPTGYWESEKLDGHRAQWTGEHFLSKRGNEIKAPKYFTKDLPKEVLDGELWAGRGNFEFVSSAVAGKRERDWKLLLYMVFDAPQHVGVFEERIARAKKIVHGLYSLVIPFQVCKNKKQLLQRLNEVVSQGGEGLTLRKPSSLYVDGYSDTLLKVKLKQDAEACIIGHVEKNRPGLCGSLKVMTKDGKIFKVSGLTDKMAYNPPPIGTIITYQYDTLSSDGTPRPASFMRIRGDV